MRLGGKVAIVTGAAQGLGKAYAMRLAEEGAQIVAADILDASAVANEIISNGGKAIAVRTDVTNEKDTKEMARECIERFQRIHILVNNAALFVALNKKPFFEISGEEWDRVLGVNLKGAFLCCKAVYPYMKQQGKGKIINVSSSTVFMGSPGFVHYVTSKGGIIAFTRSLARELGDAGISVNAVAPGLTVSDGVQGNPTMYPEEALRLAAAGRCFKRNELPGDLTGTIVFLCSDESDFITGQTIVVDGGAALH
ncbi:MAG: 3-oxoacyl-ACP reductase FabG [Desulfobacteraceae bacterium]|nr:MAG: 3-oxoacyl-ACP reductase FabG [Desulfobacteraceae bacterium]